MLELDETGSSRRPSRWSGRWPATAALVCALLFVFGGLWGWDDIEGQTADGEWHGLVTYAEVDGDSPLGPLVAIVLGLPLLASTVAWLWAPLGGHAGRLVTLLLCVYLLHIVTTGTDVVVASKGQEGWSSRVLGGTRPTGWTDSYNSELGALVAYREVVGYGAGLSLWSAIGGAAACAFSLLQSMRRIGRRVSAEVDAGRGDFVPPPT